jgi:hypothetical protein
MATTNDASLLCGWPNKTSASCCHDYELALSSLQQQCYHTYYAEFKTAKLMVAMRYGFVLNLKQITFSDFELRFSEDLYMSAL